MFANGVRLRSSASQIDRSRLPLLEQSTYVSTAALSRNGGAVPASHTCMLSFSRCIGHGKLETLYKSELAYSTKKSGFSCQNDSVVVVVFISCSLIVTTSGRFALQLKRLAVRSRYLAFTLVRNSQVSRDTEIVS